VTFALPNEPNRLLAAQPLLIEQRGMHLCLQAQPAFYSDRRTVMKIRYAVVVSALLAASSVAMAQGAGGGGGGGPAGNDPSNGANNATREGGDMGPTGATHATSTKKHHMKKTKKVATDTTNMPGADASSDTKGQ
jgi:hypothetical protein